MKRCDAWESRLKKLLATVDRSQRNKTLVSGQQKIIIDIYPQITRV